MIERWKALLIVVAAVCGTAGAMLVADGVETVQAQSDMQPTATPEVLIEEVTPDICIRALDLAVRLNHIMSRFPAIADDAIVATRARNPLKLSIASRRLGDITKDIERTTDPWHRTANACYASA